jgi:hypothetical protein
MTSLVCLSKTLLRGEVDQFGEAEVLVRKAFEVRLVFLDLTFLHIQNNASSLHSSASKKAVQRGRVDVQARFGWDAEDSRDRTPRCFALCGQLREDSQPPSLGRSRSREEN